MGEGLGYFESDRSLLPCVKEIASRNLLCIPGKLSLVLCDDLEGGMGVGAGGRSKWEGDVYIQLIHFIVQRRLIQHCKAMISQLKKNDKT